MNGIYFSILSWLLGLIVVSVTIPTLIRITTEKKLFEPHDERKFHSNQVPTIGGVTIFIGFILASFLASNGYSLMEVKYLYPAILIMFFTGLTDDLIILSPKKKLLMQIIVALILTIIGGFKITNMAGLAGIELIPNIAGIIVSFIFIIAFLNAYNFIDGIDGLASGIALIGSLLLGIGFIMLNRFDFAIVAFALAGCTTSFFGYNVFGKKHKLFMGDTGSLIIGTILSAISLTFIQTASVSNNSVLADYSPALLLAVFIVPVVDICRVVIIRVMAGRSPFSPDNNHIHHKLLEFFPKHLTVTIILVSASILYVLGTMLLIYLKLNINYIFLILIVSGFIFSSIPQILLKKRHFNISQLRIQNISKNYSKSSYVGSEK